MVVRKFLYFSISISIAEFDFSMNLQKNFTIIGGYVMGKGSVGYKIFVLVGIAIFAGSCKEENTLIFNKTKLAGVTNLRAFSNDANSVGIIWSLSPDTGKADYVETKVRALVGSTEVASFTLTNKLITDSVFIVQNLNEGTVHTFEVVCRANPSSQNFTDSEPVKIQWAPARRLNGDIPVQLFEIASPQDLSGLQFFDGGIGSHVLSARNPTTQPVLDVVIDSTAAGVIIMKSGHLNPFGGGRRRTRFSTIETLTSTLSNPQSTAPAPSSYTRDSIFIGPQNITSGKIFYAVTHDTNYIRVFFEKNSASGPGSLLFGQYPNRYLSLRFSFQTSKGIVFSKPNAVPRGHKSKE
jgi:hypothetical protein